MFEMITLSTNIIFELAVKIILSLIFAIVFLFVLRKFCVKKKVFLKIANFNIRRLIFIVSVCSFLIFIFLLVVSNRVSRERVLSLFEILEHSTNLKIINSLMTQDGDICEESLVTDYHLIENLTSLMRKVDYKQMVSTGTIATNEYVEIYVYKDQKRVTLFRITGGYVVEIGEHPHFHRYKSLDSDLLEKVRDTLRIRGVN